PVIENEAHSQAARLAFREENAPFLTAIMEGRDTDGDLRREAGNAPKVQSEDLKIIRSPLDSAGLNVYQPDYARADAGTDGYVVTRRPATYPHMASPWLFI